MATFECHLDRGEFGVYTRPDTILVRLQLRQSFIVVG
jgi:hypothetical protein